MLSQPLTEHWPSALLPVLTTVPSLRNPSVWVDPGVSDGLCKRGVSHLKEIDYGYDYAEEGRRRAGAGGSAAAS